MDGQNFQNNPYQQPVPPEGPKKTDSLAIVSLILGIGSIIMSCCITYLGIGLGIGGIICAVMSKKKQKNGMSTAGMVCSIIGLVLSVLLLIFSAAILGMLASQGYDISDILNY